MPDLVRIYVLWHRDSSNGALAERVARHFDGLGMERDGVSYRVPVRFRYMPWQEGENSDVPRPIDLTQAKHNVVVLLHDKAMKQSDAAWSPYVQAIRVAMQARGKADCYIPFQIDRYASPLSSDAVSTTQYARHFEWAAKLGVEGCVVHTLLWMLYITRLCLRAAGLTATNAEPLFVSHAKADGDEVAQQIVDHVNDTSQDIPLHAFYDAKELIPGTSYQNEFKQQIGNATLLAIVSDIYDSRPWCVWELTEAKKARRPIVLVDVGRRRISRTYPYGANLPRVKVSPLDARSIEALLLEVLSEGLRCDLFLEQANDILSAQGKTGVVLPRPPELLDFALLTFQSPTSLIVYPDPPLSDLEREIIFGLVTFTKNLPVLQTLGELA